MQSDHCNAACSGIWNILRACSNSELDRFVVLSCIFSALCEEYDRDPEEMAARMATASLEARAARGERLQ